MSDTAVTSTTPTTPTLPTDAPAPEPTSGFFLDGDAPRLGSAPILPPAPMGGAAPATAPDPSPTETPQHVVDDADARVAHQLADVDPADLPSLPTAAPQVATTNDIDETETAAPHDGAEASHPMAHLMPARSKPTEASLRAAAARAEKQAKAKKIKIGVAIGAIVVTAVVGPPLWSWLSNAINEAGGTTTEQSD